MKKETLSSQNSTPNWPPRPGPPVLFFLIYLSLKDGLVIEYTLVGNNEQRRRYLTYPSLVVGVFLDASQGLFPDSGKECSRVED